MCKELTNVNKMGGRNSNLELYRIVAMFLIVCHHYVVNSGLTLGCLSSDFSNANNVFAQLFGAWGKTGINCFMLITGYFMCKSHITLQKFLKLMGQIYFWRFVIFFVFCLFGIEQVSFTGLVKLIIPIPMVETNFTSCFILFWLFIPFLNILIENLNKKMHLRLLALCLFIYSFLYFLPKVHVVYNYVSWFIVLYFIASYLRLYPVRKDSDAKFWFFATMVSIIASLSMSIGYMILSGKGLLWSFLVDSNAPMALVVSICSFMWFKNIKIKQSKWINLVGASTFGVLLIHANSDAMRQWLWVDTLQNVKWFSSDYFLLHMLISTVSIFVICILLDRLRIIFVERPIMKRYSKLIERCSTRIVTSKY